MEKELELAAMGRAPHIEIRGVGFRELGQLHRQQRPAIAAKLDRSDADHGYIEIFRQNGVELGDATGPRIEVIASDAIDHALVCGFALRLGRFILHDESVEPAQQRWR
jgi:hypothetical protein